MNKRKQKKLDDFYELALEEMFKRVGFESYDREFTNQQWWFTKREWTLEEEVDYTKWFIDTYSKTMGEPKYKSKEVASMFIFNYGWKLKKMQR